MSRTWENFSLLVLNEFVLEYHVRREREHLRRTKQNTLVSNYLVEYQNCKLMINYMLEGERSNRFTQGVKPKI